MSQLDKNLKSKLIAGEDIGQFDIDARTRGTCLFVLSELVLGTNIEPSK